LKATNRRFLVVRPQMTQRFAETEWRGWVTEHIAKGIKRSVHGLGWLRCHLEGIDLRFWDPQAAVPVTEAMRDLVEASVTRKGETAARMVEAMEADFEACEGDLVSGVWIVTSALASQDPTLWKSIKAELISRGGLTCAHRWGVGKKIVRGTVYDVSGLWEVKKDSSGEYITNNDQMAMKGAQATEACARAAKAFTQWSAVGAEGGGSRSEKY
jgi:hypothetical protein